MSYRRVNAAFPLGLKGGWTSELIAIGPRKSLSELRFDCIRFLLRPQDVYAQYICKWAWMGKVRCRMDSWSVQNPIETCHGGS